MEWQAAPPPDVNAFDAVKPDLPMGGLPVGGGGGGGLQRLSRGGNRSTMGLGMGMGRAPGSPGNGHDDKQRFQTHVTPMHQNGSGVW